MRLLVTGSNGQVGWELSRGLMPLGEVVALDRQQCDLSRPEQLPSLLRSLKPDIIVNAAAYTAEREEPLATTVNGTAVGVLAQEAQRAGALLIHYSTDYVFDGVKDAPYAEEDASCPISAYGRSKLAGEIAVRQAAGSYVILRASWVYGMCGHDFVRTVLRPVREREELRIVADQIGAPTWARNIAEATKLIIQAAVRERAEGRFASGLFNLTASGATSWYGFAEAILECAKHDALFCAQRLPQLHPIRSEDYALPAPRPKNSRLAGNRLSQRFGLVLPDWKQSLSLCFKEMPKCEQS